MTGRYESVCELLRSSIPPRPGNRGKVPRSNFTRIYKRDGRSFKKVGPRPLFFYMDRLVRRYAWAIPCESALQSIQCFGPLVEVGAGTGYWARLLAERGVDIICYDRHPPGDGKSHYRGPFYPVRRGGSYSLGRVSAKRNLLLGWPPHKESMGQNCLKRFRGRYVIYIGEGEGGRTADSAFHQALKRDWKQVESFHLMQWEDMHDQGWIYERRASHSATGP